MTNSNNQRGTELIWNGKYDEDGNFSLPEKVSWPFQTIETVNESKADREKQRDLFYQKKEAGPWRNRLIWGDNKYVMASLLKEFAGNIDLIYIDPPFATGADFSYKVDIGDAEAVKEPSMIEMIAYRDTWGKGMDSFLQMMYERLVLMRELLSDKGSIYVHLDWRTSYYIRVIMDEIFGENNFRNDIIWAYRTGGAAKKNTYARKHDIILFYSKNEEKMKFNFKQERIYYDKPFIGTPKDEQGNYYADVILRDVLEGEHKIAKENKIIRNINVKPVINVSKERLSYDTQKPMGLLEILTEVSSNENDLVADFFCGSGTTGAVAEKLGRRWIMADLSRFSIQTTRKRLLQIENCNPFMIQNLGKYERQYWYSMFGTESLNKRQEYINTILKFYKAEPVSGYQNIHGSKGKRVVFVGELDIPVTLEQVEEVFKECQSSGQKSIDILGWEFEMELDKEISRKNKDSDISIRLLRIPKEVLDPKYKPDDVQFYDLGALDLDFKVENSNVKIEIKSFFIPHLELAREEEVREKIKNWTDLIDYWAIDWNYRDDTFHNEWQEFRTKKIPKINLIANSKDSAEDKTKYYKIPGKYNILVKVIDIFGNDTTNILEVNVK